MLVLTRQIGERVILTIPGKDGPISVVVMIGMKTNTKRVVLCFDAPEEVEIDRLEVAVAKEVGKVPA